MAGRLEGKVAVVTGAAPRGEGVGTISGAMPRLVTRSDSITALSAKAAPDSRWHQRQWQQCTKSGADVTR